MSKTKVSLMTFVFSKKAVVFGYLTLLVSQYFYSLFFTEEEGRIKTLRLLSIIVVAMLAYFTLKRGSLISEKIISVFTIITGGAVFVIAFFVGLAQWALKIFFFVIGIYFTIGGYKLLRGSNDNLSNF